MEDFTMNKVKEAAQLGLKCLAEGLAATPEDVIYGDGSVIKWILTCMFVLISMPVMSCFRFGNIWPGILGDVLLTVFALSFAWLIISAVIFMFLLADGE